MSAKPSFLILLLPGFFLLPSLGKGNQEGELQILFVGDISLSREVSREISERNLSTPWQGFLTMFHDADYVIGNLEGAVGDKEECVEKDERDLCFDIAPTHINLLGPAGFNALGLENNHSLDLGESGKIRTATILKNSGITPLIYTEAPYFIRKNSVTLGIIPVSTVKGADGIAQSIPSPILRQKLRLARALANIVIVYIHWGSELVDWPQEIQRQQARWLIRNGTDLIIGHHPHVAVAPECLEGKPVFFSLGNHLFDQKYPLTKIGLIADCRVINRHMRCSGIDTRTGLGTSFPNPGEENQNVHNLLGHCILPLEDSIQISGYTLKPVLPESSSGEGFALEAIKDHKMSWRTHPTHLLSMEAGRLNKNDIHSFLFTLEKHYSSIDTEDGPRPYVYCVSSYGLRALWRGSALAWPLIDATLLCRKLCYVCALHRGDSFITLNPQSKSVRTAVYEWNGFGFSGIEDKGLNSQCRRYFEVPSD